MVADCVAATRRSNSSICFSNAASFDCSVWIVLLRVFI